MSKVGMLVSRNNHPVIIVYDKQGIRLSPKGKSKQDIEYDKLKLPLPKGVIFIG